MDRAWQLAPGVAVRTAEHTPEASAMEQVFPAFEVAVAEPAARLTTMAGEGGSLRVCLDELALFAVAPDELAPALEASLVGWVVRTRADVLPLHAAAIGWAGEAVLFLGDKGSGKSTLAAQLGDELPYFGDEVAFVRLPDLVLLPFPKATTLKAGAFEIVAAARTWRDRLRGPVRYRAPSRASRVDHRIRALVWPRWTPSRPTATLTPLDPADAALRLIHQSFGGLERDPRAFDAVVALAALPAFELHHASTGAARVTLEAHLGPP